MITTRSARTLTRYNKWANDLMLDAIAKLPTEEATKGRPTLFKNIVHTMNHNYVIDRIFQAHLEGREHGYTARNTTDEAPPLEELRQGQREIDDWYVAWSDSISDEALDARVSFTFVGGGPGDMTRGEILLHIVNHTTYHRGFAADLFYQIPARPPTTDLTVFLRDAPPNLG
jgi:uncharacterized damage-inducible protein DinB